MAGPISFLERPKPTRVSAQVERRRGEARSPEPAWESSVGGGPDPRSKGSLTAGGHRSFSALSLAAVCPACIGPMRLNMHSLFRQ